MTLELNFYVKKKTKSKPNSNFCKPSGKKAMLNFLDRGFIWLEAIQTEESTLFSPHRRSTKLYSNRSAHYTKIPPIERAASQLRTAGGVLGVFLLLPTQQLITWCSGNRRFARFGAQTHKL
jgi:hypothetical protein